MPRHPADTVGAESAESGGVITHAGHPGAAARLLRRRRARDRDRRAGARDLGPPVYVRHEIVHNKRVVEDLKAKGARVRRGAGRSAGRRRHGLQRARRVAEGRATTRERRDLPVIDATCPLVAKVHKEGQRYAEKGYEVILIGHAGHPEVEGTHGPHPGHGPSGVCQPRTVDELEVTDPNKLAYVTQTTLSVDDTRDVIEALKRRFPHDRRPGRQGHLLRHAEPPGGGARTGAARSTCCWSSARTTARTPTACARSASELGVPSYLIDDARALEPAWLEGVERGRHHAPAPRRPRRWCRS